MSKSIGQIQMALLSLGITGVIGEYPEHCINVLFRGVVTQDQINSLMEETQSISTSCQVRITVTMAGIVKGDDIEPAKIEDRFKKAGLTVAQCTIDQAAGLVSLKVADPDCPEMRNEQSHAIREVIEYVSPWRLAINNHEIATG